MSQVKTQEWSKGVKALSVLLAVLVWLSVVLERPGEVKLTVPVTLKRMPVGLWLDSQPPSELQVIVSGPRILLLLLPYRDVACDIDLTGAGPGETSIAPTQGSFDLAPDLKVVRVFPEWVTVVLAEKE